MCISKKVPPVTQNEKGIKQFMNRKAELSRKMASIIQTMAFFSIKAIASSYL